LLLLYTADFQALIKHHSLRPHFYADDVQINGSAKPSVVPQLQSQLLDCIDDVAGCRRCNRLQLKTEIMWCRTSRRQHQLPTTAVRVGNDFLAPSTSVRDLGIFLDSDVSMKTYVRKTVCSCFGMLHQLRSVRRSVPVDAFQQLGVSLVLSRLNYGNATLVGLPIQFLQKLQSVLNASARLIFGARRHEHVTVLMMNLHCLRASERIILKVAVLTYQCLHGAAPDYLTADLRLVADVPSRSRLRSAFSSELMVPRTRLSTVGDCAFPVAAARIWNSLPSDITSAEALRTFKDRLKKFLFRISYALFCPALFFCIARLL
jgi:hypothetical protein